MKLNFQREVPENYWLKIVDRLSQKSGEKLDPLQIRAAALIEALKLPSGPYSPRAKSERENRAIETTSHLLLNHPGVPIDRVAKVVSFDFRDIYPKGIPKELEEALEILDPRILKIMEVEYKHERAIHRKYNAAESHGMTMVDPDYIDYPVHFFLLPSAIPLFSRGYGHELHWQDIHGKFLAKENCYAQVICIESYGNIPFGKSLEFAWLNPHRPYGILMRKSVKEGFNGLFVQVDPRGASRIRMDYIPDLQYLWQGIYLMIYPRLRREFYEKYFQFLKREHPNLADKIGSPEELFYALKSLSTSKDGVLGILKETTRHSGSKDYIYFPYYRAKDKSPSSLPTFKELGQYLFSDALAALKLHLIARLMEDGYIKKGPIIDYEGAAHLSSKSFFLHYPQYAMEVVLRTINELMAGNMKGFSDVYEVFENPPWPEIVKEIVKLSFKKVEGEELVDVPIDYLRIYGINPQKVIPSDKEIKEILKRLNPK